MSEPLLRVEGLEGLATTFARLREASRNTLVPRKLFAEHCLTSTADRFSAGIAPDGSPWPASARAIGMGGQTMNATGKMLASIHFVIDGDDVVGFSDDKRAAVHQEGKRINPKSGKRALAIPMSEAVANAHREGTSIRDQYPDAFLLVSEAGNAFIVRRQGDGEDLQFLYQLVDHVQMKKRVIVGFSETDLQYGDQVLLRHFAAASEGGRA